MNAAIHANISCKKWGTESKEDWDAFYSFHDAMDCSKEVEPSNRHRILSHSLWWVKRVMIPWFGHSRVLKGSTRLYNLKDDMEDSHIVADFRGKFLPSLTDYFLHVEDAADDAQRFRDFRSDNSKLILETPGLEELLMSPLANTGLLKSLWLTHNSWFLGEILPKITPCGRTLEFRNYTENSPSILFSRMEYVDWMQNGKGIPKSWEKIKQYRKRYEK